MLVFWSSIAFFCKIMDITQIKIVKTRSLVLHENFDKSRVEIIKQNISKTKLFTNPILVTKDIKSNNYVVLDGANRATALRELDIPFALVQEFDYMQEGVKLDRWCHELLVQSLNYWRGKFSKFVDFTLNTDNLDLIKKKHKKQIHILNDKEVYTAFLPEDLLDLVELLNNISSVYIDKYFFERKDVDSAITGSLVDGQKTIIIYPKLLKEEVLKLVNNKKPIPSGISRHVIRGRALHINLPISTLKHEGSLRQKNMILKKHLNNLIGTNRLRVYDGSVYLFDE